MSGGLLYLNREGTWGGRPEADRPGPRLAADGALTLAPVAGLAGPASDPLPPAAELAGPVAVVVGGDGEFFVSDPGAQRVLRVDPYTRAVAPFGALTGRGPHPGQLDGPRGVSIGPRDALYVADSGNHRIQVLDRRTGQLRAIWGQSAPWDTPEPSGEPGRFRRPHDLAADRFGSLYVVDLGDVSSGVAGRIQKLDADGRPDLDFAATLSAQAVRPAAPHGVSIVHPATDDHPARDDPTTTRLLVLDREPARVLVYHADGTFDEPATARWAADVDAQGAAPVGVLVAGPVRYVVDETGRRILAFRDDGSPPAAVRDAPWPVAGLTLDRAGRLVVRPAVGGPLRYVDPERGAQPEGSFLLGPFGEGERPIAWRRLVVDADIPPGTHLRLYTTTADAAGGRPELPGVGGSDAWDAAPVDVPDLLVPSEPGTRIWVAGRLSGDGVRTPRLRQLRLEHGEGGWIDHLPALYRRDTDGRGFLERLLALCESPLAEQARRIDDLPLLLDPGAAPDAPPTGWLDWLSGWLAAELDDRWDPERRRETLRRVVEIHGRRGTIEGLGETIALYTGVTVRIEEPASRAALWSLGETSALGIDSMLAPAEAHGAILGETAILSQSHLISDDEYGAPAFDDVAHRFCVQVLARDLCPPATLDDVRRILDRERPAHTAYHLSTIEPALRVGLQARVGIDAIVAGPPPDLVLDEARLRGRQAALADDPERPTPGVRLDQEVNVGWRATVI